MDDLNEYDVATLDYLILASQDNSNDSDNDYEIEG